MAAEGAKKRRKLVLTPAFDSYAWVRQLFGGNEIPQKLLALSSCFTNSIP